jgi:uncharacterized protein (DUF4415 family)
MNPHSKTDWERVKREANGDAPVEYDPETDPYNPNDPTAVEAFWAKATVRKRGPQKAPLKVPTTIRFDADVLAELKATGKGWQTRVNDAMRDWLKNHSPA